MVTINMQFFDTLPTAPDVERLRAFLCVMYACDMQVHFKMKEGLLQATFSDK